MKTFLSTLALFATLIASMPGQTTPAIEKILVGAGKSHVIDTTADLEKVSIASPEVAEVVAVNPRTVMINGKSAGETSAVIWLSNGSRVQYDVVVSFAASRMEAAKIQVEKEFGDKVQITGDTTGVYLTGVVPDIFASVRAEAIADTVGKVVNLLKVQAPPQERQILLKVRFADVDRSKSLNLGANLIGTPGKFPVNLTTGANTPPRFANAAGTPATFSLTDALNILMFDPHANIGATIQALQSNNVLQILAEPNLLAMNGHMASFVAGGEFPFPTLQGGGSGVGQVTIQFREFGIKLKFTPTITPRGTIRLHVAPEVSSLDYADSLTVQGSTVPALSTRKVETDVELENGQSFVIGGLLDQNTTETLSKIPGLGDIPILGRFFQSKLVSKANSELIVIVTPEMVAPVPAGQAAPSLPFPGKFLDGPDVLKTAPQNPGTDKTGPPPDKPVRSEISVQELVKFQLDQEKALQNSNDTTTPTGTGTGAGGAGGAGGYGTSSGATATPLAMPVMVPVTAPATTNNTRPNQ